MAAGKSDVDLAQDPCAIITTPVSDAPGDLVWSAWTDPAHLTQWCGPDGFTPSTSADAFRPGGVWRFVMHDPDGRDYPLAEFLAKHPA